MLQITSDVFSGKNYRYFILSELNLKGGGLGLGARIMGSTSWIIGAQMFCKTYSNDGRYDDSVIRIVDSHLGIVSMTPHVWLEFDWSFFKQKVADFSSTNDNALDHLYSHGISTLRISFPLKKLRPFVGIYYNPLHGSTKPAVHRTVPSYPRQHNINLYNQLNMSSKIYNRGGAIGCEYIINPFSVSISYLRGNFKKNTIKIEFRFNSSLRESGFRKNYLWNTPIHHYIDCDPLDCYTAGIIRRTADGTILNHRRHAKLVSKYINKRISSVAKPLFDLTQQISLKDSKGEERYFFEVHEEAAQLLWQLPKEKKGQEEITKETLWEVCKLKLPSEIKKEIIKLLLPTEMIFTKMEGALSRIGNIRIAIPALERTQITDSHIYLIMEYLSKIQEREKINNVRKPLVSFLSNKPFDCIKFKDEFYHPLSISEHYYIFKSPLCIKIGLLESIFINMGLLEPIYNEIDGTLYQWSQIREKNRWIAPKKMITVLL